MKFTGLGSFQYGAEAEKLHQQLASEKEIQMQLQDEVRLPWAPGGPGTLGQLDKLLAAGTGSVLSIPSASGTGPGRWQFIWGLSGVESGDHPAYHYGGLESGPPASLPRLPRPLGREWARRLGWVCLRPSRACGRVPSCRTYGRSTLSVGAC